MLGQYTVSKTRFDYLFTCVCLASVLDVWGERVVYSLLWGAASVLSALVIYAYGEDYVNRPLFPME